jgi:3-hydroxyisobutyrate dehydrogenase-like beta-hydroxyacid dehydrogenase
VEDEMNEPQPRIGFVGLGTMGLPICRHLLARGYAASVFDVNPHASMPLIELGASPVGSAREAADASDIVMLCLPDVIAVREAALGTSGVAHGRRVRTIVDLSTTGARVAREVASALAAAGVDALDAPVTGGIAGAQNAQLMVLVSGPRQAFERVKPILEVIARKIIFVSEIPGQAQTMKLINNVLSAAALAATAEAFVMGAKAGLDMDMLLEVVNGSSGRNSATEDKFPRSVLTRRFDKFGRTDIIYKDVCLCLEEAEQLGVPMWVCNSVKQLFGFAISQGGAKQEMTTLVKYLEQWAGVEVKGAAASAPGQTVEAPR